MIKVLFDLEMEYHLSSLRPLYKELIEDPGFDVRIRPGSDPGKVLGLFYISGKKKIRTRLREEGYRITGSTAGFDVVVTGDALVKPGRYGNAVFVHIDHGVGIKTSRIRNIIRQKDHHYHVFLEGRYWYDYIKSLGWDERADFHLTGMPKLDPLFQPGEYDRAEIIRSCGFDPDRITILFAPSYKPSCIDFVGDSVLTLSDKHNLIIKLHPYSWKGRYAPHAHHRLYEKAAACNPNVYLISKDEHDIYPYLFSSDTLISDTSSVINEFLALGRFGIIYDLPHFKEKHSDGMDVLSLDPARWLAGAFPHINSPDRLEEAVEKALNPTDEMKIKLGEYRDYFFTGLDGKASGRVKAVINQLAGGEKRCRER